jgi:ATP-dependent helicase HrpA
VALPPWLRMNLRVSDASGRELGKSRDLDALRRELRGTAESAAAELPGHHWERDGVRSWDFGDLAGPMHLRSGAVTLRMFPGIEDAGSAVRLKLYPSAAAADAASAAGVVRLAALALRQQHELILQQCAADRELVLLTAAAGMDRRLFAEIADRAMARALQLDQRGTPRTAADFEARLERGRSEVTALGGEVARIVRSVLMALREARAALAELDAPLFAAIRKSIEHQLEAMLAPGWVRELPEAALRQLPKYIRAAARRAERLRNDVERDRRLEAQVTPYERALQALDARARSGAPAAERHRLRWMIEEFRLSLFAQELRTLEPVSARRLDQQLERARAEAGA